MKKQDSIGKKKVRIKKINDYNIKCENCGQYHQVFSIEQNCFHVFGIPFIPLGKKTIRCSCASCNDCFNEKKKEDYLYSARTPIYMFSGLIIALALITYGIYSSRRNQELITEYVKQPKLGDVYVIRNDFEEDFRYYFLKLVTVRSDSLFFLFSYLMYDGRVSEMNDKDYFITEDTLSATKSDLIKMHDKGTIESIERDYPAGSRFNIEQRKEE